MNETKWFQLSIDETLKELSSSTQGLTDDQYKSQIEKFGSNTLPTPKGKTVIGIFISQFKDPLIYILIAAGIISAFGHELNDALFIAAIITINAGLGTWQEYKAESSANSLKMMIRLKAKVKRNGKVKEVDSEDLVPGDIVLLASGLKVPADLRLIEVNGLSVEEALLTGESLPVNKSTAPINDKSPALGDQVNMAFAATTVLKGRAVGVVTSTAFLTEIGKIAESLSQSEPEKPPLIQRMEVFSKKIGIAVVGVCLVLGVVGWLRGMEVFDIFFFMVAVGVSAIPEGLPVALTVGLSVGTSRMAKRNVIVRKLPAVEGLGSCTLIASDKTGTLTMDQQSVHKIFLANGESHEVTGIGYNGEGEIKMPEGRTIENTQELFLFVQAAILANESTLRKNEMGWEHSGDAVDVALKTLAFKSGKTIEFFKNGIEIVHQIPYESENKFSGVYFKKEGELYFAMKGAAEVVKEKLAGQSEQIAFQESEKLAAEGFRVLALASGKVDNTDIDQLPKLLLLGLAGLIDPLREEAKEAVEECHKAGIEVIMVTGDHPATALAIAKQLGIAMNREEIMSGTELTEHENKTIDELCKVISNKRVFARVTPLQKKLIIECKKKEGHFVAVTGDGANDAPALKSAHIGIAMGGGTDLAKDVSSIIVTDNNFASITAGVEEGRFTFDNLRKIIYLLLSTGAAELMLVGVPLLIGMPLPFFAVQLLWLNIVTNGIQDIALAFEKGDKDVMKKPARDPSESIFDPLMLQQIFLSAFVIAGLCFGLWYYLIEFQHMNERHARSFVMMLMVMLQNFHVLNCRSETKSMFSIPITNNWFLLGSIIAAHVLHISAAYIPGLNSTLQLEKIRLNEWLVLLPMAASIFLVMELFKWVKSQLKGDEAKIDGSRKRFKVIPS